MSVAVNDPYEGVVVMTQDDYDDLVRSGCAPCCHACQRAISVGDRWMFKTFIPKFVMTDGLVVGDVRGTCCEECVLSNRDLSADERERLETRLGMAKPTAGQTSQAIAAPAPAVAAASPPPPEPARRWGCFVLPDGRRF